MPGKLRARLLGGAQAGSCLNIPDRQDATSLGETRLLLDAADTLLEDGGDLGGSGLGIGVGACLYGGDGGGSASCLWLWGKIGWLARRSESGGVLGCDWIRDPKVCSQVPVPIQPQPQPQLLGELGTARQLPAARSSPSATARGRHKLFEAQLRLLNAYSAG